MKLHIPAICVVASGSGRGKTRLITGVVSALAVEKLRICVIKHTVHPRAPDSGKDTQLFRGAGAAASGLLDDRGFATVYVPECSPVILIDMLAALKPDLVLCEGFKGSNLPKIAIADGEADALLLADLPELLAVVAKDSANPPQGIGVPILKYDAAEVARFIIERFLRRGDARQ